MINGKGNRPPDEAMSRGAAGVIGNAERRVREDGCE